MHLVSIIAVSANVHNLVICFGWLCPAILSKCLHLTRLQSTETK